MPTINKFVRVFGYGSSLMLILFDLLLNKYEDSNTPGAILNIILSCRIMYETCKIFISRRRIQYTKTINFYKNKLNQCSPAIACKHPSSTARQCRYNQRLKGYAASLRPFGLNPKGKDYTKWRALN